MRVRLFSVKERRQSKAADRASDRAAAESGRANQRQRRNRFIPDAREWTIETVSKPLSGEVLD
jgi:hypothetical protein